MTTGTKIKIALLPLFLGWQVWLMIDNAGLRAGLSRKDGQLAAAIEKLADERRESQSLARELDDQRKDLLASEAVNQNLAGETTALRARLKEVYENEQSADI